MRDPEIDRRFRQLFDLHEHAVEQLRLANESLIVSDNSVDASGQSPAAAAQAVLNVSQAISRSHQELRRVYQHHDEAMRAVSAAARGAIDLLDYMQSQNGMQ